jgi:hypothetical protein
MLKNRMFLNIFQKSLYFLHTQIIIIFNISTNNIILVLKLPRYY